MRWLRWLWEHPLVAVLVPLGLILAILANAWFTPFARTYKTDRKPIASNLPPEPWAPAPEPQVSNIDPGMLLVETNHHRAVNGVRPVVVSDALNKSALDKCFHMSAYNYWSHFAPDGTPPWTFIRRYTTYIKAGENLSYGSLNALGTVRGWKESPEHNKNLLDPEYTYVGFGVCKSEKYVEDKPEVIVVQHFIRK